MSVALQYLSLCFILACTQAREDILMRLNYGVWLEKQGILETGSQTSDWYHIVAIPKPDALDLEWIGINHMNMPAECSMDISDEITDLCIEYSGYWNYHQDEYNDILDRIQKQTDDLNGFLNVEKHECNSLFRCRKQSLTGQMESLKNTFFSTKKSSPINTLISEAILLLEKDTPDVELDSMDMNVGRQTSVYASSPIDNSVNALEHTNVYKNLNLQGSGLKLYGDTEKIEAQLLKYFNSSLQLFLRDLRSLKQHADYVSNHLDSLMQLFRGYITPHIVRPKDAKMQLDAISGALSGTQFDIAMKTQRIYSQTTNHFAISMNYVYVAIKIPLVNDEHIMRYTLYKMHSIALPIYNSNIAVTNHSELSGFANYIALQIHGDAYIELSEAELVMCQRKPSICPSP